MHDQTHKIDFMNICKVYYFYSYANHFSTKMLCAYALDTLCSHKLVHLIFLMIPASHYFSISYLNGFYFYGTQFLVMTFAEFINCFQHFLYEYNKYT